jgi:uncharacterized protein YndB with AHSA1/START domain
MTTLQHLRFTTHIAAPVARVWDTMLELDTYRDWTSAFCEDSTFEGAWDQGARIRFLAPSGDGMVAEIAENRRHAFVSIRHLGVIANGVEDTTSEAVQAWAPACENYRFTPEAGGTRLDIEQDIVAEYAAMMDEMWPRALARLKALCESPERA